MTVRFQRFPFIISLICLMLLVSACSGANNTGNPGASGSSDNTSSGAAGTDNASSGAGTEGAPSANNAASGNAGTEKAAFPRTIKTANGDVTIQAQPKRVAVVNWGYVEPILVFSLPSVGLALPFTEAQSSLKSEAYKPFVANFGDIETVGENTQVNMEKLLAYAPDLIIAGNATNKDITAELAKIAPTVMIDEQTTDVWTDWPALVAKFGEILGQEDTAAQYVAQFDDLLKSAKEKLAGLNGSVAFVQVRDKTVWLQGTKYMPEYYEGMGLTPPSSEVMTADGGELSLEGLTKLDPDYLFLGYFNYDDKSMPAATDEWEKIGVWNTLKAVKNKHVFGFNGALGLGYGPIGQTYGVKAVLDALDGGQTP